jgi:allantoinase
MQVWDPDAMADTSTSANFHKHKVTPYEDLALRGRVMATFVRGSQVYTEALGVSQGVCGGPVSGRWTVQ